MLKVAIITPTKNRHHCIERLVRFVMDQTYENYIHIIFNNSLREQRLNSNLSNKFLLINNPFSLQTKAPYLTLGDIYNDINQFIPEDVDLVTFMDDDDVFFPDHLEEGVKGYLKGGKKAYKPKRSYYKHGKKVDLVENVLEPSIFVEASHVKEYGFGVETSAQHHKWLQPLIDKGEIFVDPEGKPTYICDWSQEIKTFKTSGDPNNPNNFKNYDSWSSQNNAMDDGIITPVSKSWAEHYCKI